MLSLWGLSLSLFSTASTFQYMFNTPKTTFTIAYEESRSLHHGQIIHIIPGLCRKWNVHPSLLFSSRLYDIKYDSSTLGSSFVTAIQSNRGLHWGKSEANT